MNENKKTYISLFSSAGVGCFGFKLEGFECIATNELIERRLNVQKFNKKCKYNSGYICGDITREEVKKQLFDEITFWNKKESVKEVDVVIATPPCQGMSVANHKKKDEIKRNSLVVESINIIKQITPKIFIFENVSAFLKTICTDNDSKEKKIEEAINNNLSDSYSIMHKIINFKNYGSMSSRTRTLVIGVRKDLSSIASPIDLFPDFTEEKTLREVIGDLSSLHEFYEFDPNDIYHFFRGYACHMRPWISHTPEGESAFDNEPIEYKPHQIINNEIVVNVRKNGDKYTRVCWDKVGPCIHTRNDQLASQNTIHPHDDRVFSIRELMRMMSIPSCFKWSEISEEELNSLSQREKVSFMKREEIKIRQSIGEAVPTAIFQGIAKKINKYFKVFDITNTNPKKIVEDNEIDNLADLTKFIQKNYDRMNFALLQKVAEYSNSKRVENSAYYTDKDIVNEIEKILPDFEKNELRILEPSVGVGNFIPAVINKYADKKIILDVIDIDSDSIAILDSLMEIYKLPKNVSINYICADFLGYIPHNRYDLVIGNPPFTKTRVTNIDARFFVNYDSSNYASFFLEKACHISDYVCMVMPKNLLNTPEYTITRDYISKLCVENILDFGEKGFKGVLIETICLGINTIAKPADTTVNSITNKTIESKKQKYIFDKHLPYWLIYRNDFFDSFYKNMQLDIFTSFRDRQLTNTNTTLNSGDIRVLKSRNINDDGTQIIDIEDYDAYVEKSVAESLTVYKYLDRDDVFLTPNMTYNTRVMKKPKGVLTNGSLAVLELSKDVTLTDEDLKFFSSKDFREYINIARNYQTRSLNIDKCSVYFFGKRR